MSLALVDINLMITQYDAVAEIEAMKWKRSRPVRRTPVEAPASPFSWTDASEDAVRTEMERRLANRAGRSAIQADTTAD